MKEIKIDIDKFIENHNSVEFENEKEKEATSHMLCESFEAVGVELRVCSKCNNLMEKGYVVGGGESYYCTDQCLHSEISEEEWAELATDEDPDNYWTEWN